MNSEKALLRLHALYVRAKSSKNGASLFFDSKRSYIARLKLGKTFYYIDEDNYADSVRKIILNIEKAEKELLEAYKKDSIRLRKKERLQ